jgi:hypothetical protein
MPCRTSLLKILVLVSGQANVSCWKKISYQIQFKRAYEFRETSLSPKNFQEAWNRPTTQANDVPLSPLKFRTKLGQDILKWKLTSFGNHPTAASRKRKGRILSQQVSETQFMEVCEFRPVENTFQAFRC